MYLVNISPSNRAGYRFHYRAYDGCACLSTILSIVLTPAYQPPMTRVTPDRDAFSRLGQILNQKHSDELSAQLSVFQSVIVNLAFEQGDEIRSNPEFRIKFIEICLLIGIDPLELLLILEHRLRKNDDFYGALAIKVVETCQQTRDINGGLISMKELCSRIREASNVPLQFSDEDVTRALGLLKGLGEGFELLVINRKKWIRHFTPLGKGNISSDHRKVYELCDFMGGFVTYRLLRDNYGWDKIRLSTVIEEMILDGFLWIDEQSADGLLFWEPSWISK